MNTSKPKRLPTLTEASSDAEAKTRLAEAIQGSPWSDRMKRRMLTELHEPSATGES